MQSPFEAQRQRLTARLALQRQAIEQDVEDLKEVVRPLSVAKSIVSEAANSLRDNQVALQSTRLMLAALPFRFLRHPVVGLVTYIAVPMLVRNGPKIAAFVQEKAEIMARQPLAQRMRAYFNRKK